MDQQRTHLSLASMLREHGAQRPTVFEILVQVHRIRGTKSKFTYAVPVTPPLIPRTPYLTKRNPINPLNGYVAHSIPPPNAALSLYGPGLITNMAVPNQGTQARDKVLDAIAPMRRGRPTHGTETNSLRPSSFEEHHSESTKQDPKTGSLGSAFDAEQDRHWQKTTEKTQTPAKPSNMDDAWTIESVPPTAKAENTQSAGFSDNFTENLSTPEPNKPSFLKSKSSPRPTTNLVTPKDNEMLITPTPLAFTGSRMLRPKQDRVIPNKHKEKDAFEGLGLMSPSIRPAPTLGEARMLRTGLASMSSTPANQGDYLRATTDKLNSSSSSPRPTPSPRPSYFSPIHSQLVSPLSTQDSPGPFLTTQATTSARLPPAGNAESLPIESRFPSVEELDGRFVPSVNSLYPSAVYDGSIRLTTQLSSKPADVRSPLFPTKTNYVGTSSSGSNFSRPNIISNVTYSQGVVRSEKITGMGKKDLKEDPVQENNALEARSSTVDRPGASQIPLTPSTPQRRQSLVRKHRSSVSIKLGTLPSLTPEKTQYSSIGIPNSLAPPKIPPRPPSGTPPRDWLTGEEHEESSMTQTRREGPVLRDSPRKRASFIAQSDFEIPASSAAQHVVPEQSADEPQSIDLSLTVSRFKRAFPEIEKIDVQANTNSLSGLTDNWSPVRRETEPESSSSDEWPEDPGAATSLYAVRERNRVSRNKEQQNSVHELVNQYGGGLLAKEKEFKDLPFQTIRTGDYTLRKVQTTGLAPPVKQEGERKTPSPTSNTMTTALAEPVTPSKPSHRPQTSISTHQQKPSAAPLATKPPTSTSGRSRPQSMFIFPSKSSDISTPVPLSGTNNLAPPEELKARAPRRTSISDMVQKYEAISGKVITTLPPGPPSPVRSVSARDPTSLENGRRFFADGVQVTTHQTASAADGSNRLSSSPSKSNAAASDSVHQNIGLGKSPSQPSQKRKTHYRIGSDNWKHVAGMTGNRKLSIKTEPIAITSSNLTDALAAARVARAVNEQDSTYNSQVSRKRTLSIPNPTSSAKADEPRTPVDSERPYQGVGKLIDQWQKKSAEAEQSRPLPPGKRSFTPKRVGTIPD